MPTPTAAPSTSLRRPIASNARPPVYIPAEIDRAISLEMLERTLKGIELGLLMLPDGRVRIYRRAPTLPAPTRSTLSLPERTA